MNAQNVADATRSNNRLCALESLLLSVGLLSSTVLLSINMGVSMLPWTLVVLPIVTALGVVFVLSASVSCIGCHFLGALFLGSPSCQRGHEIATETSDNADEWPVFADSYYVPILSIGGCFSLVSMAQWLDGSDVGLYPLTIPLALISATFVGVGGLRFSIHTFEWGNSASSLSSVCAALECCALLSAGARTGWILRTSSGKVSITSSNSSFPDLAILVIGLAALVSRVACYAFGKRGGGRDAGVDLVSLATYSAIGYAFVQVPAHVKGYVSLCPVLVAVCAVFLACYARVAILRGRPGHETVI